MKSFVIILKNNPKSEKYGLIAVNSGRECLWNINRFDGIDGRLVSLTNYNLTVNTFHKKCINLFKKPGVVGCFLSHYLLWKKCIEINETIAIFEDDVLFLKPPPLNLNFNDVLKLDKLDQGKKYICGDWWEGAHSYILTPSGAKKLVNWANTNGALPADWILGTNILNINFDTEQRVILNPESQVGLENNSLTKTLIYESS
jgi:GR25 family glycosyltransferase involved in LPS biosynthesis